MNELCIFPGKTLIKWLGTYFLVHICPYFFFQWIGYSPSAGRKQRCDDVSIFRIWVQFIINKAANFRQDSVPGMKEFQRKRMCFPSYEVSNNLVEQKKELHVVQGELY